MTGSSYVPIVVPIVAFLAMAVWLGLVFYADRHPGYQHGSSRRAASADGMAAAPDGAALPASHIAGPREHERIDERQDVAAGAPR